MDVQHYRSTFALKNGLEVTLRAIRPDDGEKLLAAYRNLEPRSIYTRFFTARKEPTAAELAAATNIDFDTTVALVAIMSGKTGETIIGAGRYVILPQSEPRSAEVAFATEEDYQGLGLAGLILGGLAGIALAKGVVKFIAEVLPANAAMLSVFRRCGKETKTSVETGLLHVEIIL
jgi:RimJ/RimL family protein N-acetyltransferase